MYIKDFSKEIGKEVGLKDIVVKDILRKLEIKIRERLILGEDINIAKVGKLHTVIQKEHTRYDLKEEGLRLIPKRYKIKFKQNQKLDETIRDKTVYDGSNSDFKEW